LPRNPRIAGINPTIRVAFAYATVVVLVDVFAASLPVLNHGNNVRHAVITFALCEHALDISVILQFVVHLVALQASALVGVGGASVFPIMRGFF